jgi:hypothetical protein
MSIIGERPPPVTEDNVTVLEPHVTPKTMKPFAATFWVVVNGIVVAVESIAALPMFA